MRRRIVLPAHRLNLHRRAEDACDIILQGHQAYGHTGSRCKCSWVFWTLGLALATAFFTLVFYDMADAGLAGAPQGTPDLNQVLTVLDQIVAEQRQQRAHLDTLQQAVGTTAQGVGVTQQVTETVVSEVVQQVQSAMAQRQQESQDQMQRVAQAVGTLQAQVQRMQSGTQIPEGSDRAASGSPRQDGQSHFIGEGGARPSADAGGFGPRPYPTSGVTVNPAIAYAIQQGGVDSKVLARPSIYDPVKMSGYMAFNDWSDHVITCVDAQIPGTWEIMEYLKDTQPVSVVSLDDLCLHFPNIDRATLEYSNSNLYAVLITYTLNEARNIVRQARRPNGYEAWKLLQKRFNPVTIGRQRAGLTNIANPATNIPIAQLSGEIVAWETRITEFEARPSAERISESIKMAAVVSMCPTKLRDHLQLNAQRFTSYNELREEIFVYLDHMQSAAATNMDVGSLQKGGGKGCYECGGPHFVKDCPRRAKGKGKDKGGGKGKFPFVKGKGKKGSFAKDGGKGKGTGKKGGSPCSVCGKMGHTRDTCWNAVKGKALNSVDPRLSQLQSEFARAAMEEYNKRAETPAQSEAPTRSAGSSSACASSSPGTNRQLGGFTIKQLGAISMKQQSGKQCAQVPEDDSVQTVTMHDTYVVRSNVDSGAAISVAPWGTFPDYPVVKPQEGCEMVLIAANNEEVQHYGEVRPVVMSPEGHVREMTFQLAGVNKILTSATQICNKGYRLVLESEEKHSYIEDCENGDQFELVQEDGIFIHYLHVVPYRFVSGFSGQPQEPEGVVV